MNSTDIKVEQQYGLPHEHEFAPGRLGDFGHDQISPPASSPSNGFGPFEFTATDTLFTRPFEPSFSAPPTLHPLNTGETTLWPSQITNPSDHVSHPVALPVVRSSGTAIQDVAASPPLAPPPLPAPVRSTPVLSTARRTLSDDDRRRMCKYHDENPSVKQTEIGGELKLAVLSFGLH